MTSFVCALTVRDRRTGSEDAGLVLAVGEPHADREACLAEWDKLSGGRLPETGLGWEWGVEGDFVLASRDEVVGALVSRHTEKPAAPAPATPQRRTRITATRTNPTNPCWCGCTGLTKSRFVPGHDARFHGTAKKVARGLFTEDEVSEMLAAMPHDEAREDFTAHVDAEKDVIAIKKARAGSLMGS